jgi:hypothetical protein
MNMSDALDPTLPVQMLPDGRVVVIYPATALSRHGRSAMADITGEAMAAHGLLLDFQLACRQLMDLFEGEVPGCEGLAWCSFERTPNEHNVLVVCLRESGLREGVPGAHGEDGYEAHWAMNDILGPYLRKTLDAMAIEPLTLALEGYSLSAESLPRLLEKAIDRHFAPGTWTRWQAEAAREDLSCSVNAAVTPTRSPRL